MYCSHCGAEHQLANAFCKRCGEWLPDIKAANRVRFGGETPQQNIFTGLFLSALSTLAALVSAIALYATYLGRGDAKWSVYLAAAFCLCIAGWQASSFAVTMKLRKRMKKSREIPSSTSNLTGDNGRRSLGPPDLSSVVNAPNVTEHTTNLLEPIRNKVDPTTK
jgi:hypothetical protein